MGIEVYNEAELDHVRHGGRILSGALQLIEKSLRVGISTLEIDQIAEEFIRANGGEPSFKGTYNYPFSVCTSINDEAVHGMPRADKIIADGDIVSVDVGVRYNGFCTDAARTFAVGNVGPEALDLIKHTEQSFWESIRGLKAMSKVGDIGARIEDYIKKNTTYSIIRTYLGHGIGKKPHQDPLIPNYRLDKKSKVGLKAHVRSRLPIGSIIAIEPMINAGTADVKLADDKWTVSTADGRLSAHYENTLIILADGVEVVTIHDKS
ncbi:MAG: type I methionyl aminopeptidase [Firmicutes bacterium]|nr:type I methionyl aminopeptidase [Bacillota bacterium]